MKLAFCLFKYFPFGGLQRDFYRIATTAADRGHEVHIYTMTWEGEIDPRFTRHLLPSRQWTNHGRIAAFLKKLKPLLDTERFDAVIGFNKMPYLDFYYAADVCYIERIHAQRGLLYRLLPRYHFYKSLEQSVFAASSQTKIMLISPLQQQAFMQHYHTQHHRFILLPPGIAKERAAPLDAHVHRQSLREKYQIRESDHLVLMVGSGFKTKGVDRAIRAIAALPATLQNHTYLYIIGHGNKAPFEKLAKQLKVNHRVQFLGARSDVSSWLLAADLLLHPSYHENTGTVLLEAMIAGLPVLTLDVCGYARYVMQAQAGKVLSSPFSQDKLNQALSSMLQSDQKNSWRNNGLTFAKEADIYSMPTVAMNWMEQEIKS
jgi:UDP-glucose:(heptosyl)LPS alpha-1,3-glucosyltransferase